MEDFIKIGQRAGDYMLVVTGVGKCGFINVTTGYLYDSAPINMAARNIQLGIDINSVDLEDIPNEFLPRPQQRDQVVTFRHLLNDRAGDKFYGVTFAILIDFRLNQIDYGVAVCNGDKFSRRAGRAMAKQRLVESPATIKFAASVANVMNYGQLLDTIKDHIELTNPMLFKQIDRMIREGKI